MEFLRVRHHAHRLTMVTSSSFALGRFAVSSISVDLFGENRRFVAVDDIRVVRIRVLHVLDLHYAYAALDPFGIWPTRIPTANQVATL